jgi:hypothetical protein
MATRTVRLDADSERILAEVRKTKRLSVSAALKEGLLVLRDSLAAQGSAATPYAIYRTIDLGKGGGARAAARDAKSALTTVLRRKVKR